jgi:hypothetical protein
MTTEATDTALTSARFTAKDAWEAIELCHRSGWTDGLPVIPPTVDRVASFVDAVGRSPDEVLGVYRDRGLSVTVEKAAINAVMAGCLPEYFPVVLAIVEAMFAAGGLVAAQVSTGGAAVGFIVNGPVRILIGMNCRGDFLGPGNRANASIGRSIRLIQKNAFGSVSGAGNPSVGDRVALDRATLGQPARYVGYHIVENEEDFPDLDPMHVELGYSRDQSVATVFPAHWHAQISAHTERSPQQVVDTIAHYALGHGKLSDSSHTVIILPPEIAAMLSGSGWSKETFRQSLYEATTRSKAWVKQHGFQTGIPVAARGEQVQTGDERIVYAIAGGAERIYPVIAGGPAGAFIDIIYSYSGSTASKEIAPSINEALEESEWSR